MDLSDAIGGYKTFLFDLDGTLTDPGLGITNSVMHALAKKGISVADRAELYRFIGPPLVESFETFYGFSHEDAVQALADYREYFAVKGLFENEALPGAAELLAALKAAGRTVVLATSKPEPFARRILEHFGLLGYFDGVHGATMDETRNRKADVIAWALAHTPDHGRTVMVGDRHHDIEGARANGLDSIGVLCGYGDEAELRTAGATFVVLGLDALRTALGAFGRARNLKSE